MAGSSGATSSLMRRRMNGAHLRRAAPRGARRCRPLPRSARGTAWRNSSASPSRPGIEEVEQRPQLAEVVLDGVPDRQSAVARHRARARGLAGLAARVLDRLRLVEDEQVKRRVASSARVAREQRVGRDARRRSGRACAALRARSGAVQQPRRAACGANRSSSRCQLPTRLVGATISAGASRRPASFSVEQVRDRLQRLAEPHVVGEDAARAVRAQVLQPAHAFLLVRAQRGAQAAGHGARSRRAGQRPPAIGSAVAPDQTSRRRAPDDRSFGEGGVELAQRAGARGREARCRPPRPDTARRAPASGCAAARAGP